MRKTLKGLLKVVSLLTLAFILLGEVNHGKITISETSPSPKQEETYSPMDDSDEENNRGTNGS